MSEKVDFKAYQEETEVRWQCPNKRHVLGLVVQENGKGRGLLLFRHAVVPDDLAEAQALSIFWGLGEMPVECDACRDEGESSYIRTWVPGEYEMRRFVRGMERASGPHVADVGDAGKDQPAHRRAVNDE